MCSNNCVNVVDLDYVVLKLNGNDITSLSSYEAVQMFLQAKETLVVELSRKKNTKKTAGSPLNSNSNANANGEQDATAEICNKAEGFEVSNAPRKINDSSALPIPNQKSNRIDNELILTLRVDVDSERAIIDNAALEPTAISKETQTNADNFYDLQKNIDHNTDIAQTLADHFIEQQHHLFEQCLEPEIDIEEVTLVRNDSFGDQIGISVCSNGFFNNTLNDEGVTSVICNDNSKTDLKSEHPGPDPDPDPDRDPDPDPDPEVCEDVFVGDIQSESIADRDGRLKRGDQILRINGIDIKNKNHAVSQIAENSTSVTLLVSRILYPEDDDDDDDEDDDDDDDDIDSNFEYANRYLTDDYTNVVDKLDKVLLAQRQSMKPVNELASDTEPTAKAANKLPNNSEIIQKSKAQINTEKAAIDQTKLSLQSNSGCKLPSDVSSGQVMAKNLPNTRFDYDESEHIYETIPEDSESEPLYCSPYQSSNYMTAMGSCSSADVLEMQQQTQRVAQWLGLKSQISSRSVHTLSGRPSFHMNTKQQMNRISNRVYTLRSAITNTTSGSSSSGAGYYINNRIDSENPNTSQINEEVDNSSSAYNTGGSNNSASPRQHLLSDNVDNQNTTTATTCANNRLVSGSGYKCTPASKDTVLTSPMNNLLMLPGRILCSTSTPGPLIENTPQSSELPPFTSASAKSDPKLLRPNPNPKPTEEQQNSSQCPQFNAPNLSRYHFVSSQEVANKTVSVSKPSSILVHTESASEEIPMVWKVKRRPDGTRYIVKRPVRNQSHVNMGIRKNMRNNEITTTEDDTISEVKIGRYWTKEERKRHIERARERRHHQLQLQQQLQQQQQFPT